MYTLVINEGPISIAHKLELPYESLCNQLHGHNYYVKINIGSRELDENGMVVDFAAVKQCIKKYDHSCLGENLKQMPGPMVRRINAHVSPSTAEVFAHVLWRELTELVIRRNPKASVLFVTVWETRKNMIVYAGLPSEEAEIRSAIGDKETAE